MRRTALILWAAIDCKNTRSYYKIRLRFLQPMQSHNLSTFHPQQSLNLGIKIIRFSIAANSRVGTSIVSAGY